jgi:hypothetical protein
MGQARAGEGEFFALLAALRNLRSGPLGGDPSDRALARAAEVSPTTIGSWLAGSRFPQDIGKFLIVMHAVMARAAGRGITGVDYGMAALLDEERWLAAYRQEASRRADNVGEAVVGAQAARALTPRVAGRLLTEVSDPFALEVHRPVQPEGAEPGLPTLPGYVRRDHDHHLGEMVRAAAEGSSGIAVLVGGSSTGKTRACWEALGLLRELLGPWRLWHPIDPSRPEATLRELPFIGPRTVVWLNEAQFYLEVPDSEVGEQVAAGLRELLRDPNRAPVLVLATLWPQFWDTLTARPPAGEADPHAQARELLSSWNISVPGAFTRAQMQQITGAGDPRLALAAATARDGQVIQFLAGAPELLARYDYAPPAAKALINAAIDARRLGMGVALPVGFLEAAAPGYLTESEWDGLGEDWLEQALAYTAAECKGVRGPLTRIRPRPSRMGTIVSGSAYRLADYLDQHGRRSRRSFSPPTEFWTAAADLTDPRDLGALARAAEAHGLLEDDARLYKAAAAHGNARVASTPARLRSRHPAGDNPPRWVTSHAALDDPYATGRLLDALRSAGAADQVEILLARDPAAHAALDNPYATARLLYSLRAVGATDQIEVLLAGAPAAHAALDNPYATARLLYSLRAAGAADQVEILLARDPAAHAALDHPYATGRLLDALRSTGAADQVEILLARDPAAYADLDNPYASARLLAALRAAGATDQVEVLLARDPAAHAALSNPDSTVLLLDALRAAGATDQVKALAARAVAHAPVDDPAASAQLLDALRATGTADQIQLLAARAAAQAALDNPYATGRLLDALRSAGAPDQVEILLARDPATHAALDNPYATTWLLDALRSAGAADQVEILLVRDPATHAALGNPDATARLLHALRAAGATGQVKTLAARAAAHAPLGHPAATARLLGALRAAGATGQVEVLLARDPATHAALGNPDATARLLRALRAAGATGQVEVLLARDPATYAAVGNPEATTQLLHALRAAGATGQVKTLAARAAAHAPLDNPAATARLLGALRAAGATGQVEVLLARDPATHAALGNPEATTQLLKALRAAGATGQVEVLLARDPATHAALGNPEATTQLLNALRAADAALTSAVVSMRGGG